jgi:chaperonin GroEL
MSTKGYIPKNLTFDAKGRQRLIQGISKISKAVKSTLGPRGKTVLIESPDHIGGITITKDGVTVAKSIFLDDPVENLAIQMMKDAANRTSSVAGDGTTTAIVLTEAIIKAGSVHLTEEDNVTEIIKHINNITDTIVTKLKKESKKITKSRLLDVATLSVNNDREIGRIIGDAYDQVGNDGIVTVEKSMTAATYAEVTNGIKIDRGYTSNLFINNQRKDECVLEDVQVLVCDTEITNILQIENVLKPIIQERKQFLIIGPCSTNVVNTLAANVLRNGLKICNISPPNFGYKQHELMQDIALTLGATYFSEKTGDDLSLITSADLGHADKIIVNNDSSVIIKHQEMSEEIKKRVEELKEQQSNATTKQEKDFINERIASLSGAIGCIYVGGNSDVEQKEKFDRVDDSVCAVRSALEEGIIPGGGLSFLKISHDLKKIKTLKLPQYKEWKIARNIICDGIESPFQQIITNSGKDYAVIEKEITLSKKKNYGYDVKNEVYGDMYKMGIIDPLKVTRNALINAVSVATTILSTNAIVTHARIKE